MQLSSLIGFRKKEIIVFHSQKVPPFIYSETSVEILRMQDLTFHFLKKGTVLIEVVKVVLVSQDLPLFEGIYKDLFPGVDLPQPDRDELIEALKIRLTARNLQASAWFLGKVVQVYEMILVRHGLMVVGEPMGGKTCAYQVISCCSSRFLRVLNCLPNFIHYLIY